MADHIEGWWTIGEAPNYEINDEGVVRHKANGRIVKHHLTGRNKTTETVMLSSSGKVINRSVNKLVQTGRRYQGV